ALAQSREFDARWVGWIRRAQSDAAPGARTPESDIDLQDRRIAKRVGYPQRQVGRISRRRHRAVKRGEQVENRCLARRLAEAAVDVNPNVIDEIATDARQVEAHLDSQRAQVLLRA